MLKVYLIGSLRNPDVPYIGNKLRALGFDVFDDWFAGGPEADDYWQQYEETRGRTFVEALYDRYATHIWAFDREHLDSSHLAIMVCPVGRSAHLELGYIIGQGKPGYIYLPEDLDRWDVMYRFATGVFTDVDSLVTHMKEVYF